ncbi:MAG: branched-chain amino acid ABC transporter permease, partial [Actinomycetales bacterium]|nr:branched-chain amino acid ABC transporter permease [Actinomycetales bacterium]
MNWISSIIQGILLGGFYALVAAGLSFMFGVMRIVNLAHGALVVVGAYLAFVLLDSFQLPLALVLVIVVVVMAILGFALQRGILNRALQNGGLTPILVTFGLAVIVSNFLQVQFSADSQSIALDGLSSASITVSEELSIGVLPLITFIVGVVVIAGLQIFLNTTSPGRAMRATSDDQATAQLMGIDNKKIYAIATAIALATVGIAGVFLGLRTQFSPNYGD